MATISNDMFYECGIVVFDLLPLTARLYAVAELEVQIFKIQRMMIVEQMLKNAQTPLLHIADVSGSALFQGDCLDIMPLIPDKSIKLILADLPYGTTANKWDSVIPLQELWAEYERVLSVNGCVLLFSSQPFTTDLINSKRDWFKYEIIWDKMHGTDFQLANIKPMKSHENILVFAPNKTTYNKQTIKREKAIDTTGWKQDKRNKNHNNFHSKENIVKVYDEKNPTTVIQYSMANGECNNSNRLHSTQKPVFIISWLLKTYSNDNDMVLDNTMGSGTTCLAAKELNRKFIGIEKEAKYYEIACQRCGF